MRTLRRHVHHQAGANCTDAKLYFWTIFQFFFYPNGTWTHPPTSKLFFDFWNCFNFAKPLSKRLNVINEGFEPGPSRLRVEHYTVFHLMFSSQTLITLTTPIMFIFFKHCAPISIQYFKRFQRE